MHNQSSVQDIALFHVLTIFGKASNLGDWTRLVDKLRNSNLLLGT